MIGTDESYLNAAGLSFDSLAGVVPIDGAGYHVPEQVAMAPGPDTKKWFWDAFGRDRGRQLALSPTEHASEPNAPRFLILHVERHDSIAQVQGLANALREARTPVQVASFPDTPPNGHRLINQRLGDPDYAATAMLDAWLRDVFAE